MEHGHLKGLLARADDHLLDDIGLTRSAAQTMLQQGAGSARDSRADSHPGLLASAWMALFGRRAW